jgi:hypothetical protein
VVLTGSSLSRGRDYQYGYHGLYPAQQDGLKSVYSTDGCNTCLTCLTNNRQNETEGTGVQAGWKEGEFPATAHSKTWLLRGPSHWQSDDQRTVCSTVFNYKYIKCRCFPWVRHLKCCWVQYNILLPQIIYNFWFIGNATMKVLLWTKIFNYIILILKLFTLVNRTIIVLWSAVQFLAMYNKYWLLVKVVLYAVPGTVFIYLYILGHCLPRLSDL